MRRGGLAWLVVLAATAAGPGSAAASAVKHVGHIEANPVPNATGCELATFFKWSELPGAVSYTLALEDTQGFGSGTSTFPPYNAEAEGPFAGNPPVGNGQHRIALTYQAGPCGGFADDASRFTVKKFTASYTDDKARIVGSVTDEEGAPVPGVRITISGPSSSSKKTNAGGTYGTTVKEGRYTVGVEAGYCLRGGGGKCKRSTTLEVKKAESVNFVRGDEMVTLSGTVYTAFCIPAAVDACYTELVPRSGAAVQAVGQPTDVAGPAQYTTTASASGEWSMKVKPGTYAVSAGFSAPEVRNVNATVTRRGLDFCPAEGDVWGRCEIETLRGRIEDDEGGPYTPALASWGAFFDGVHRGDAYLVKGSKGRFELLVPKGRQVEISALSVTEDLRRSPPFATASKKVTDKDEPILTLKPGIFPGFTSAKLLGVYLDGLPFRRGRDFTLELERVKKPSANDVCQTRRRVKFEGGQDDSLVADRLVSRHQAYVELYTGFGDFCIGSYEVRIRTAEGETILRDFTNQTFAPSLSAVNRDLAGRLPEGSLGNGWATHHP